MSRRILVTSALPYANGHIHLGHLVEYLQTDMWVRFQKLRGNECVYICADDTHGTAIMIRARKENCDESDVIARMRKSHLSDFNRFQIAFDEYGSTNSDENREICHDIWKFARAANLIAEKEVEQLFDPIAGTFLADRFVKGTCPFCKAEDQYGDSCEKCGKTYTPKDLVNPHSTLSGATPELRTEKHLFFQLEKLHGFLNEWTQAGTHLQPSVAEYLKNFFLNEPLRDWDISRPAPYFGFEIPDFPGHYWYVWYDAPIGYVGTTLAWCKRTRQSFESWWKNSDTEIHHFIGKDITYFHTLFWPAMLHTAQYTLPSRVHIHGFLTVDGEKMSKSRGTFVQASTYLDHLDPAYLRYYYASKLGNNTNDLDLNLDEFVAKVNSDLVGKVVNLASRTARFVQTCGLSSTYPEDGGLFAEAAKDSEQIANTMEDGDFNRAMRLVMTAADRANLYIDQQAPWTLVKDPANAKKVQDICTVGLNLFRQIVIYLAPVLPELATKVGELLGEPIHAWEQAQTPLIGTPVNTFEHLMVRVKKEQVEAMIEAGKEENVVPQTSGTSTDEAAKTTANTVSEALTAEPFVEERINIDQFGAVDLRVAEVLRVEEIPEARKLLKLTLGFGGDVQKTVFAGIKAAYTPERLTGRLVLCVVNLEPRKMKFGTSEGMVLCAGTGGSDLFVLSPDSGAKPGQRIH
ncbi:MAG: methionine--tRNA ligase [Thermoguttaceae bacterium]|nr:methionine--tRNA ligase [Thermoguttaceae bacterium]